MTDDMPIVNIYTDGACDPNPGPGGWAALLRFGKHEKVLTGSSEDTTNNRMELTAAVEALATLKRPCRVHLYTDSEYLKKGITEWMANWRARNWRRKKGVLANVDLWKQLDQAIHPHVIEWHWVRGHAGHRYNERVDKLARGAISKS
ncbi:MAG: ribonuclease HI [Anaerolineales bacterium]|jgi:ribonuclease HI